MILLFVAGMGLFSFLYASEYKIGAGDVLDIVVWGHPELSMQVAVSPEGTISFPLLGEVKVEGLSVQEIKNLLTQKLAKDFIRNPQVFVKVVEFNSQKVMVLGEVSNPGEYVLKGETRLLQILSQAGGVLSGSPKAKVIIMREENGKKSSPISIDLYEVVKKGNWKKNIVLKAGDIIYVSTESVPSVHIMGEIKKPGSYPWKEGLTAFQAILMAGGLTETASRKIKIIRENKGGKNNILYLNLKEILGRGNKSKDISLKPGDIIYVPTSFF